MRAPITQNRYSICKWVCLHVCVLKAESLMSQMLMFCQNNLLGIFMSCTRPQLGYRWGKRGRGWLREGLSKSRTLDPRRTNPCSRPKTPKEFWMNTAIIQIIMSLTGHSMSCVTNESTGLSKLELDLQHKGTIPYHILAQSQKRCPFFFLKSWVPLNSVLKYMKQKREKTFQKESGNYLNSWQRL